jgi:hypothetical protein
MAVTITRSAWIDDDGTGTTGTVINNAVKTSLYNEIDTALAKVPQLAGGNAFTGPQTVAGTVAINGANPLNLVAQMAILADMVATRAISIQNSNPSNAGAFLFLVNSAGTQAGSITHPGDTTVAFNTTSDARLKDDAGRAADLSALRAVVVHDFIWRADGVHDRGIFAQEARALYPRAVSPGTDDLTARGTLARPWMTDYSKFVPDLIAGWQQHDADLADLRAALATLKGSPDAQ